MFTNIGTLLAVFFGAVYMGINENYYDYGDYYYDDYYYDYKIPSDDPNMLFIDNPTENEITVRISNFPEINIKGNDFHEIETGFGSFELYVNGEKKTIFLKSEDDGKSFLNPTQSKYIIEDALYAYEYDESYVKSNIITLNDKKYEGPFTIVDDYYIKGDYEYGLGEELPYDVDMEDDEDFKILKKIYRIPEFVDMYYYYYDWDEYDY